jgi:hypothetical protein
LRTNHSHPTAQLWGKGIADDEKAWRDSDPANPAIGGDGGDGDQDGDDTMDVDRDEAAGADEITDLGDFIPGCYDLDLGVKNSMFSNILVRDEYTTSSKATTTAL